MEQTPELNELAAALAKAQGEMESATKDSTNPHFQAHYASLNALRDACRKPLADNGLAIIQALSSGDGVVSVTTRLLHTSGQWLQETLSLPLPTPTAQQLGSAITYLRRYALSGMLGLAAEDDDGEATTSVGITVPAMATRKAAAPPITRTAPVGRPTMVEAAVGMGATVEPMVEPLSRAATLKLVAMPNFGALYAAAMTEFALSKTGVLQILGVRRQEDIADLDEAWAQVVDHQLVGAL